MDRLIVVVQSVKMPVGFGRKSIRSKGRPLHEIGHEKKSIIRVKSDTDCLAHALIIAIARLENDPKYISYRMGRKTILPAVQSLLETTGIDLQNGGGVPEIRRFQDHYTEYKIVVYSGLNSEDIIFEGQPKRWSICCTTKLIAIITSSRTRPVLCVSVISARLVEPYARLMFLVCRYQNQFVCILTPWSTFPQGSLTRFAQVF